MRGRWGNVEVGDGGRGVGRRSWGGACTSAGTQRVL